MLEINQCSAKYFFEETDVIFGQAIGGLRSVFYSEERMSCTLCVISLVILTLKGATSCSPHSAANINGVVLSLVITEPVGSKKSWLITAVKSYNNNNNLNIFMQDSCFSFKKKNCYQRRSCKKLKMKK